MSEFNFVGAAYEAASPTQDTQELINWYPENDPTKSKDSPEGPSKRGVVALYPTPGLTTLLQLVYGEVRGFHVQSGGQILYAVCGSTVYSITPAYVATSIGTLQTISGPITMDDNGVALYIVDGDNRYTYTWGSSTFATVASTDGSFTGGLNCSEVDNYLIYSRPNTNQWGCTNVGSIISGNTNLGQKIGYSDNIVGMYVNKRQVFLIGEVESEWWIDVGSSPFPFAIIPGTSMQHGCAARNSIARLGESVAFLSQDTRGNATVVMMNGYQPQRISTFAVENAIQKYPVTSDAVAYTYAQSGHEFYVLTFPTADVTWCFDLATGLWHKRAWRDSNNVLHRHRSNCAALFNGDVVVGDWQNGKVYLLDQTVYTDAGDAIPCIRRCPHLVSDFKRQFFSDLQIQFQPGVGLQTGQGKDPECLLRWSNDGGFTWGPPRKVKIGKAGKYKNRAIKRRLGWARDRVFEVEVTDPVYRVVVSANLNASAGAN